VAVRLPGGSPREVEGLVQDPKEQVVALAAGADTSQLRLSAAEGYLLSRIDGGTSWHFLREIGGIPPASVDACLFQWLKEGLVEEIDASAQPGKTQSLKEARPNQSSPSSDQARTAQIEEPVLSIDERALDDGLEIGLEVQRRILEFEMSLEQPSHELLGIEQGATPKTVKHAYYKLSKEFHPDRYFRKSIGAYGQRLDRIFKRILEAHEILSDPELSQVAYEPSVEAAEALVSAASPPVVEAARAHPARSKPLTKLERLRQRMPFEIDHAAIQERRARADEIFRAAQDSQIAGRFNECEASLRIAMTFDPDRAEFKEALGSLRIAAAGARASKLLATPSDRMSGGELREALGLLEGVLLYRPHDLELNERAARVCIELGKLEGAQEYAEALIEGSPESADGYALLGRIYKDRGDLGKALQAFEMAIDFDEENVEARRALAAVRIGERDIARGGMS
jgi:tetratricopeptide (TPR) repeat protein